MNIENKLLKLSSLEGLVLKLNQDGKQVFAPVKKDNIVNFAPVSAFHEMTQDYIVTARSAKFVVFPRVETILEMQFSKDNITLKDKDLSSIPDAVLLGTRPCDAAGFKVLTSIFEGDYIDNIYVTRLKKTTIISISCNNYDAKCFCTSVNVHPGGTAGSDILLTRIDNDNFLAEIVTEKGKEIVNKFDTLFDIAPDVNKDSLVANVPVEFDLSAILGKIYPRFESDIWVEQSLRCIGCGTCAYVCPTCGCFDIQDVSDGHNGQRKRSWDSCGFDLFTLHSSGHNPRNTQSKRWRQRILHKFVYVPEQDNILGCVGCGRCSRACSVDMNLKEHLINLIGELTK